MNNLVRYYKTISAACLWIVFLTTTLSNAYSFDNNSIDLSLSRFLDTLSYNYKGFQVQITEVSIGEIYDDNVTFSDENETEDFITIAGFEFGVQYEGKARSLELLGNISNQTFAKNSDFNNVTEGLLFNFKNEFTEYDRIRLSNDFSHSDAPIFFREDFFDEQFGRREGRFDYFKNRFYVEYTKDITKQLTAIARYDNHIDIFSGADIQNSYLNKVYLETDYLFSSTTISLFSYEFANRQFEGGSDASINTVTAGVRQYITKKFYFDGRAGLNFIDSFDGKNHTEPVIRTSLSYQKDNDTLARLLFEKKHETYPYNEDIFDNWRTTASVTRQLLERLRCSLSIFYGEGEYISSNFKTQFLGANSTLIYDVTKYLKGNFAYTYSQADANFEAAGYTKNTVFLGLTAEF